MVSTQQLSVAVFLSLSATLVSTSNAEALVFNFTKLVDTSTSTPDGSGTFSNFDYFTPAVDNGTVAFWAESRSGQPGNYTYSQGIYTYAAGTIKKIVDTSTLIPGSSNTFSYLGQPSIDQDGNIAFWGALLNSQKTGYANWGIYAYTGGTLNLIADKKTLVPDGSGRRFDFFNHEPAIDNGVVAFSGMDTLGRQGVYTSNGGVLNIIADRTTPIPGGTGNFVQFPFATSTQDPNVAIDNGSVVFLGQGSGNQRGVYTSVGGVLTRIADQNTPNAPYGSFTGFFSPSIDGGDVVFIGADASIGASSFVYTSIGGVLSRVAEISGNNPPSIDNGNVLFAKGGNYEGGLFTTLGGALTQVLDRGDLLDGGEITHLYSGREALSENSIAFQVRFADGYTQAIYIAEAESVQSVPTPALLPGLLALSTQVWRRRRQQRA